VARYYPVSPLLWTDQKVRTWNDATFRLAIYVLTCRHRNLEGLYWLPIRYAAADLGWTAAKVRKALTWLIEDGFVDYDAEAEVILVCNALKYQAPKSDRQVKGAVTALQEVPPNRLVPSFMEAVSAYAPALAEALTNGYREP
jgi:hypothetical protein